MKEITPQDLYANLNEYDLVDVRELSEHREAHIPKSILLPLGEIDTVNLPNNKKPIVLYCKLGKRSKTAAEKLLSEKPELELYSLKGGIVAWQDLGLPVEM